VQPLGSSQHPLLLIKSGSAGNRSRTSGSVVRTKQICSKHHNSYRVLIPVFTSRADDVSNILPLLHQYTIQSIQYTIQSTQYT
jgi:hypothetical protein